MIETDTHTPPPEAELWHAFVPFEKAGVDDKGRRMVRGIASTEHIDLQGEIVLQQGIDTTYFLKHGFINDDHQRGPEFVVGEPTDAKQYEEGLYIEGFLYKNHKKADAWWEFLNALEASDSKRKAGFSIQGKVLRRGMGARSHVIERCWLQDVAITKAPINTHSFAEIVKAMVEGNALSSVCGGLGCNPWIAPCERCAYKSHRAFRPEEIDLRKREKCNGNGGDDEDEDGKAMCASSPAARVESLDSALKVLRFRAGRSNEERARKSMVSFPEAVALLQFSRGYSRPVANALAGLAFEDLADGQGGKS